MRAEIMAIGDELTTGQRLDTNTQWLAERLCECGVEVAFHTTVGDQLADHEAAIRVAVERADVVISTGGLGPTADDLTRQAVAIAAGVELVRDESSLAAIRELFARRGREMPERNVLQAEFPAGARPIANQYGTAPGIDMAISRAGHGACRVFALPGVPAEMFPMWHDYVGPAVRGLSPDSRVIRHFRLKCFGVGESQLEAMLPDMIQRGREPVVGITVSDATITLRITASGADETVCRAASQSTIELIRSTLGELVFGEEDDELQDAVLRLLAQRGQTLAVGEWATGGLLGHWLSASSKHSHAPSNGQQCFRGGVTVADVAQIAAWDPTVDLTASAPHDPVVAVALASAAQRLFGADYGLGVAAFPQEPDVANAHVAVALATPSGNHRWRFSSASHPSIRQPRTAKQALDALRRTVSSDVFGPRLRPLEG